MQPNPWDDGEVSNQDSAIAGDVHTGATIHNHSHGVQPTSAAPQPASQVIPHDSLIVGVPQNITPHMGQQIVYLQQQSSAPKVIGIFVIIWGAISFVGALLSFLPVEDPMTGEELVIPTSVILVDVLHSVVIGSMSILGGYWMTQYQKKGIHLVLFSLILSYALTLLSVLLGGDGGLGELLGSDSAVFTLIAVTQGICSVICGLIVAIPLMTASHGLDNSSLF